MCTLCKDILLRFIFLHIRCSITDQTESGAASSTALTDEVWPDGVSFDVPVVNPHQPVIISRDAQLIPEGLRKARSSNWMLIVQIGDMNMWAICNTRI
ncbi:uncharacterized protein [Miscanthus floridulus]|uniref:uncharacterized protein isoform X3 n=1 Tax=Miscanthus floridulus TaxID=154761 RepID=UPI0034583A71